MSDEVTGWIDRYRSLALATVTMESQRVNRATRKLLRVYRLLRETEEGRAAITVLLEDNSPHVRIWAGAHSLAWAPEQARPVLEQLRESDGARSFEAKWTLIEYDRGNLAFD